MKPSLTIFCVPTMWQWFTKFPLVAFSNTTIISPCLGQNVFGYIHFLTASSHFKGKTFLQFCLLEADDCRNCETCASFCLSTQYPPKIFWHKDFYYLLNLFSQTNSQIVVFLSFDYKVFPKGWLLVDGGDLIRFRASWTITSNDSSPFPLSIKWALHGKGDE